MPMMEFKQGSKIYAAGEDLRSLAFITKGGIAADFNGHVFQFVQGDMIGLCDLDNSAHSITYAANTGDISAVAYDYNDFDSLGALMRSNSDVANLFVGAMLRQLTYFYQYWATLKKEAHDVYSTASEVYSEYERLCSLYSFTPKKITGIDQITDISVNDTTQDWLRFYYTEIKNLDPSAQKAFFRQPEISLGFLRKASVDIRLVLAACKKYQDYLRSVSDVLLSRDGHDLFAVVSELHANSMNIRGADNAVKSCVERIVRLLSNMTEMDRELVKQRLGTHESNLDSRRASQAAPVTGGLKQNLADSLDVILSYSGCDEELCGRFSAAIHIYSQMSDKTSPDDDAYRLRRELTAMFNEIYQTTLLKSLNDTQLPTIIKMFLNFGYVDAALAGYENAEHLYSIADSFKGDPKNGVYTTMEWFSAIYHGEKEPSRNDFDTTYADHIQEQLKERKITEKDVPRLLEDGEGKVLFEVEHVFPVVNKVTFGRITSFCPIFVEQNVQRKLDTAMVTPAKVKETLADIIRVDPYAYRRESLFTHDLMGSGKEYLQVEVLPDIVLMPNIGVRGTMWQEIEGRDRTSPSRMFISAFTLVELSQMMIGLTADFRWEMRKRIQGSRWSDVTDPSLTSAYFDYLQFYRVNKELSADAKSNIKTELSRARNAYKAVFSSNYAEWLQHESNGSPRLNKFARKILFEYCPFPAEIRDKLAQNPQYAEMLKRHTIKTQQATKKISNIIQKITVAGGKPPKELQDELDLLQM